MMGYFALLLLMLVVSSVAQPSLVSITPSATIVDVSLGTSTELKLNMLLNSTFPIRFLILSISSPLGNLYQTQLSGNDSSGLVQIAGSLYFSPYADNGVYGNASLYVIDQNESSIQVNSTLSFTVVNGLAAIVPTITSASLNATSVTG